MKIMKYTLWATVGLSLLFASCESILDINPKDRLTTKDYFTNEEQLQLYSNQFYSNNFPGDGDIYKDNADVLIVSPLDDEVSGQRVIPETGGGWSWSALRSIKRIILRMKSNYNYTVINSIRITSRVMAIFTRIMLMC